MNEIDNDAEIAMELATAAPMTAEDAAVQGLHAAPLPYRVWGAELIDAGARSQMDNAMRLPVSVAGALMPDAHIGYGLPIGGVLACDNVVIPYAVGVDIACRMRLSIFEQSPIMIGQIKEKFERSLQERTRFGAGVQWKPPMEDEVLDDPDWSMTPFVKRLFDSKAVGQLGTSGSGNHFVEWGALDLVEDDPKLKLPKGKYLALLSHSGSRGTGAQIAELYSGIARKLHPELALKGHGDLANLGWLGLQTGPGQEYWQAMNLMGRYASANHRVIHKNVAAHMGLKIAAVVENHHNFAWEETWTDAQGEARKVIVHRKGATPAGAGVLGMIPGTMADVGYVVRGRGVNDSLGSASHGAGRALSRTVAKKTITKTMHMEVLAAKGVTMLGGGRDEAPQAYKRINDVIAAQAELVDVIGRFQPKIVMMTDDPRDV